MQQMVIYWQSIIPQHVSGVFTPIIRTAELRVTAYGFLTWLLWFRRVGKHDVCTVKRMLPVRLPDSPVPQQLQPGQNTIGSDMQFCSPDDGRKDAQNMLIDCQ